MTMTMKDRNKHNMFRLYYESGNSRVRYNTNTKKIDGPVQVLPMDSEDRR